MLKHTLSQLFGCALAVSLTTLCWATPPASTHASTITRSAPATNLSAVQISTQQPAQTPAPSTQPATAAQPAAQQQPSTPSQQPMTTTPQPTTTHPIPQPQLLNQPMLLPAPPDLNVKAYVLMDAQSGQILAQKNMNQRRPPASLTKMMTLYLASRALQEGAVHLDDPVLISKKAWKIGGSKMFVRVGQDVPLRQLIEGIIVDSGNDACVATAEYIAGSESSFVDMMNTQAKSLGMLGTHYGDCTGLPHSDHYSTAHDLALLARAIVVDFPNDYSWYKQKWFTYNGIRQPNRNRLLWRYPYADGIKTGHTKEAGFCLVSSALKDGMRLVAVVMGAPTDEARAQNSISLFTYGFRFFESHPLYQADTKIVRIRVWYGDSRYIKAGVAQTFAVVTPRGQFSQIKTTISPTTNLKAPIKQGQTVGDITVTLRGKVIAKTNLVALEPDLKGGLWRRGWDHAAHFFHGWFHKDK